MEFVKAPLSEAETIRKALMSLDAIDLNVKVESDASHIYFPLRRAVSGYDLVVREPKRMTKPRSLAEALSGVLTPEELQTLTTSYDIVGSIAIVDIEESLTPKEQLIAQAVLDTHTSVTTVLKKAVKHGGEFRTQQLTYLAGEDTRETVLHESGCRLLVDVEQVYFSVRLSTERLRVASLVKPGENILVLFSGAAPYVVLFAKKTQAKRIVGVEKNPVGHQYGLENLRLNKVKNAELFNADAADLSFLHEKFDRILMPHPSDSIAFLPAALSVANEGATIHLYIFGTEEDLPRLKIDIQVACASAAREATILKTVKAGHHAPYVYRWCIDFTVS
jgi:tRNA (guanine37-N1)-methyltransferase